MHAICHITGGGLPGNLPRVLAEGLRVELDASSWNAPAIFDWLQTQGNVEQKEMYRTFNCGIGLVLIVAADVADGVLQLLQQSGEQASVIGQLHNNPDNKEPVSIKRVRELRIRIQNELRNSHESTYSTNIIKEQKRYQTHAKS